MRILSRKLLGLVKYPACESLKAPPKRDGEREKEREKERERKRERKRSEKKRRL
jgi:hypothetical protein